MALALPFGKSIGAASKRQSQIPSVVDRARRAWLEGDGRGFAALFLPDGEFIVPGQLWRGPDAVLSAFEDYISGYRVNAIEVRNLIVQCDPRPSDGLERAILEWDWEDTKRLTGETSRAEDAIAIDLQDGQVQRWREYIDATVLSQQD